MEGSDFPILMNTELQLFVTQITVEMNSVNLSTFQGSKTKILV